MSANKKFILLGLLLLTFMISGCGHDEKSLSASTIFTSEIKDTVTQIIFYANDNGVNINNKDDIENIYDSLSSLSLTEAPKDNADIEGGVVMEIVTAESTISFHITSKLLSINDVTYNIDRDVLTDIRDIVDPYI